MEERVPEVVATSGVETGDERGLDLPVLAMSRSTEDLPEVHGCACQRHRTCGRTARGRGPTADLLRLCGERVHSSGEGFVPPSLRAWFPCRRGGSTSRRKLLVQSAYLRVAGRVQARLVDGDKLGGPRRGLRGHEVGRRPGAQHVVGLRDPAVARCGSLPGREAATTSGRGYAASAARREVAVRAPRATTTASAAEADGESRALCR
mmetsp:Transcript_48101/g.109437  ORF Transcript_48101/g.109437 Transcript_48101/m.109437 type:complete len:206 (-) Transcript_48101:149-766(-)